MGQTKEVGGESGPGDLQYLGNLYNVINKYKDMMIYDLSRGMTGSQINEYYGVDIEEIQEKLRDNAIWILCGFEQLLEIKSFYYTSKN